MSKLEEEKFKPTKTKEEFWIYKCGHSAQLCGHSAFLGKSQKIIFIKVIKWNQIFISAQEDFGIFGAP